MRAAGPVVALLVTAALAVSMEVPGRGAEEAQLGAEDPDGVVQVDDDLAQYRDLDQTSGGQHPIGNGQRLGDARQLQGGPVDHLSNLANKGYNSAGAVMYNSAGAIQDPSVLWEKTEPVAYGSANAQRTDTLMKRDQHSQMKEAVEVAKSVCTEAFAETKLQCAIMAAAGDLPACRAAIKAGGEAIVVKVEAALPAGEDATRVAVVSLKRAMLTHTRMLGEASGDDPATTTTTTDSTATDATAANATAADSLAQEVDTAEVPDPPQTVEALSAIGCEAVWKATAALCEKGNIEKDFGKKSVAREMEASGNDIATIGNAISKMGMATAAPTAAPTAQVFAKQFVDTVGTYSSGTATKALPNADDAIAPQGINEYSTDLEERLGESIEQASESIENFHASETEDRAEEAEEAGAEWGA